MSIGFLIKKIIVPVVLFVSCNIVDAQQKIKTINIDGEKFVEVTVDILIFFLDQKYIDWETDMKKLGFKVLDEQENVAIYYKESKGSIMQCISKNKLGIVSIDWYDYKTKKSLMSEVFEVIKPYYYAREDDIDFYEYKSWIIGATIQKDTDFTFNRILIKKQ